MAKAISRDRQDVARAAAGDTRGCRAPAFPQSEVQIGPSSLERGRRTHHDGRRERHRHRKQEHADVDINSIGIWKISGEPAKEPNTRERQGNAERPARQAEQPAFDQQLPHQAAAARTERCPHRKIRFGGFRCAPAGDSRRWRRRSAKRRPRPPEEGRDNGRPPRRARRARARLSRPRLCWSPDRLAPGGWQSRSFQSAPDSVSRPASAARWPSASDLCAPSNGRSRRRWAPTVQPVAEERDKARRHHAYYGGQHPGNLE